MITLTHSLASDPLMTVKQLALYLGKPSSWVYAHINELPGFKLNQQHRFRRVEIDAWLETQRIGNSR